jgi:hypothetical protein
MEATMAQAAVCVDDRELSYERPDTRGKFSKRVSKKSSTYPLGPLDPFLISPSGDPYWSHPENVAALDRSIQQAKEGKFIVQTMEEFDAIAAKVLGADE